MTMLTDAARDAHDGALNRGLPLDLEALTEQLWDELGGEVDRRTICSVLTEVAARYRDARITTFVPIFVRRDALEILRSCPERPQGQTNQGEVRPQSGGAAGSPILSTSEEVRHGE
jgi:hypothetical protein